MSYPVHPDTIVIRNDFYPQGVTEKEVWDYYQTNKLKILQEVDNRDLIFFVMVDFNEPVVLRSGKTSRFIRLKPENYDTLITGRTISIHSTMKSMEDFGIIDIDCSDFEKAKKVARDVYQFLLNVMVGIVSGVTIRFTGKRSFHIICQFRKKMQIDTTRTVLKKLLSNSRLAKEYTIAARKIPGTPNLDLAPNKKLGGFITPHSLSVIGLKCMNIPFKDLVGFRKENAKIK
jgi:hypothetical protein